LAFAPRAQRTKLAAERRSLLVLVLDGVVHLLAVHGHGCGRLDADSHLVAADVDDRELDVVADHDRLVDLP
jgi:hypothetical protein